MRVAIDGRMLGWTGIGRYTRHLIEEIARIDSDTEYCVLLRKEDAANWRSPGENFFTSVAEYPPYGWKEQVQLPSHLRALRPDLVHFMHFNAPITYNGDFVVTVHDLTMFRFPSHCDSSHVREMARKPKQLLGKTAMARTVRRARRVLADCQFTADDVERTFGLSNARITVAYPAADSPAISEEPVSGMVAGERFLLYVGNAYPHKNLGVLVDALEELSAREQPLQMVLAGPEDECVRLLRTRVEAGVARDRFRFVGQVTDGQLEWLYRNATLFVLPSLAEGFGLTGVEAMARGLPVVSARSSCLPEIYGDAAEYFDPTSSTELAHTLARLLADSGRRDALREAGLGRAAMFSWSSLAKTTLQCYREVAGG